MNATAALVDVESDGALEIVVSGAVVSGGPFSDIESISKLSPPAAGLCITFRSRLVPVCFAVYETGGNCCQAPVPTRQDEAEPTTVLPESSRTFRHVDLPGLVVRR